MKLIITFIGLNFNCILFLNVVVVVYQVCGDIGGSVSDTGSEILEPNWLSLIIKYCYDTFAANFCALQMNQIQ